MVLTDARIACEAEEKQSFRKAIIGNIGSPKKDEDNRTNNNLIVMELLDSITDHSLQENLFETLPSNCNISKDG